MPVLGELCTRGQVVEDQAVSDCNAKFGNCITAGSTTQCMIIAIVNGTQFFIGFGPTHEAAATDADNKAVAFYGLSAGSATVDPAGARCAWEPQ